MTAPRRNLTFRSDTQGKASKARRDRRVLPDRLALWDRRDLPEPLDLKDRPDPPDLKALLGPLAPLDPPERSVPPGPLDLQAQREPKDRQELPAHPALKVRRDLRDFKASPDLRERLSQSARAKPYWQAPVCIRVARTCCNALTEASTSLFAT